MFGEITLAVALDALDLLIRGESETNLATTLVVAWRVELTTVDKSVVGSRPEQLDLLLLARNMCLGFSDSPPVAMFGETICSSCSAGRQDFGRANVSRRLLYGGAFGSTSGFFILCPNKLLPFFEC